MLVFISGIVCVFPLAKRRPIKTLMSVVREEGKMREHLQYLAMILLCLLLCIHILFQNIYRYKDICNHWQSYTYKNLPLMVCGFSLPKKLWPLIIVSLHNYHARVCIIIWGKSAIVGLFVPLKGN